MNILTLTTDIGFNNFYLAPYKGLLYKKKSNLNIVDISSIIEPFNLQQASFVLANAWRNFPSRTIHNFRVGEEVLQKNHFLLFEIDDQLFIIPDNGVIRMLFPIEQLYEVYRVTNNLKNRSNSEFLATIISYLFDNKDFSVVGEIVTNYKELLNQQAISSQNYIRGIIQYIDGYGNLITNITKQLFYENLKGRDFEISLRSITLNEIFETYTNSPTGDLCLFNEMGYLQISVFQGNASELYNLNVYDSIQIDFKEISGTLENNK